MADAYGTLLFAMSENCKVDHDALLKKLNSYEWSESGTKWELTGTGSIISDEERSAFPTTYPKKLESVVVESDKGDELILKPEELESNFEGFEILEYKHRYPELDEICLDLAQPIHYGWIQVSLTATMSRQYGMFQALTVYSNGEGVRHYCMTGHAHPAGISTDYTSNFQAKQA